MKILSSIMSAKSIIILLLFLSFSGLVNKSFAQEEKIYDHYNDTLIILDQLVLDTYKVLVKREQVLAVDTLKVNQEGLSVSSFTFSALSLGANVSIASNNGIISEAMKAEIKSGNTHYKFIYIKDIVLKTVDGKTFSPSLKNIKITFSN